MVYDAMHISPHRFVTNQWNVLKTHNGDSLILLVGNGYFKFLNSV